jgi:hypothetical protein
VLFHVPSPISAKSNQFHFAWESSARSSYFHQLRMCVSLFHCLLFWVDADFCSCASSLDLPEIDLIRLESVRI